MIYEGEGNEDDVTRLQLADQRVGTWLIERGHCWQVYLTTNALSQNLTGGSIVAGSCY